MEKVHFHYDWTSLAGSYNNVLSSWQIKYLITFEYSLLILHLSYLDSFSLMPWTCPICFAVASSPFFIALSLRISQKSLLFWEFWELRHMATADVALERPLSPTAKTFIAVNWVQTCSSDFSVGNMIFQMLLQQWAWMWPKCLIGLFQLAAYY